MVGYPEIEMMRIFYTSIMHPSSFIDEITMDKQPLKVPDQKEFDHFAANRGFEKVFNSSYSKAYALFSFVLSDYLKHAKPDLKVLDIGCGDGWTAEFISNFAKGRYFGIDSSAESIKKLEQRVPESSGLKVKGVAGSAEWIISPKSGKQIEEFLEGKPDLIVCNASCHQIRKSYPDLRKIFAAASSVLEQDGTFLVGDYYFPEDMTEDEVEEDRNWIKTETGQTPTPRTGFIVRNEMELILESSGFISDTAREIRGNRDIRILYYLFVSRKTFSQAKTSLPLS
ncbi:MAG: class I SAM-dependent methyltransferase [Victivallales bacterium]